MKAFFIRCPKNETPVCGRNSHLSFLLNAINIAFHLLFRLRNNISCLYPVNTNCSSLNLFVMSHEHYQECIDACNDCAVICNHCAMSCLQEQDVKAMTRCIQLDLECAAICRAAVEVMSMNGEFAEQLCQLCADICNRCAEECERHADMEHCRECAETCRRCAEICAQMAAHV